jgi:hypothetical protein
MACGTLFSGGLRISPLVGLEGLAILLEVGKGDEAKKFSYLSALWPRIYFLLFHKDSDGCKKIK